MVKKKLQILTSLFLSQINKKKIAGVLCEVIFHPESIEVILGIGINVNMESEDLALIDQPATSLKAETQITWDKHLLLKELQHQFLIDLKYFIDNFFLNVSLI